VGRGTWYCCGLSSERNSASDLMTIPMDEPGMLVLSVTLLLLSMAWVQRDGRSASPN
jgi:hypothetical protein